jgi:DNA-binding CsgD family transcriptional regulator/tetratricopeptide (TPR) repeat protein
VFATYTPLVAAARPLICPILVGRDDLLELAERRLSQTADGRGHMLFLAGEAGIGKTRLLEAIVREARGRGFATAGGDLGPRDLEVPAGLIFDLTRSLGRHDDLRVVGESVRARLAEAAMAPVSGGTGSRSPAARGSSRPPRLVAGARQRRWLVADLVDLLAEVDRPTVLAMDNLHWADDLSLEVLAGLAARLPEVPMCVVGTYRSDELYPRVPMREWRSRLVTQRLAEEARLGRLASADIGTMTTILLQADLPAARTVVEAIAQRTDGIPLHIEELLGVLDGADLRGAEAIGRIGVPDTIERTIQERLERRSGAARALAAAAAVIGRPFSVDAVADVWEQTPDAVALPLQELVDHFFLVPTGQAGLVDFRHALIRDACYATVPAPTRRRMHGRAAALADRLPGAGQAFASAHFELAGCLAEAHLAAVQAARAASALSAHREAAQLYQRALRTAPDDVDDLALARLLEASGDESAAIDDNEAAARAYEQARDRYREAGDRVAAASVTASLVGVRHLLGDDLEARLGPLHAALDEVDTAAAQGDDPEGADRARLRLTTALSAAYMLDRRLEASLEHGATARALARRLADQRGELHALATIGSDLVFAGRMDDGWSELEAAITGALDADLEEEAARAYRMAGSSASVLVEYERAERYLVAGIAFAEQAEMWNHQHYMAAHLAHVRWATGDWDAAETIATRALADGRGGITTRITALYVLGYVSLGRGQLAVARQRLEEALGLGDAMRELQRRSPAMWGLAEVALASGDAAGAIEWCGRGHALSAAVDDAAYLFPYLVTGTRAFLADGDVPAAQRWVESVSADLRSRDLPGARPAVDHARGLVLFAGGSLGRAQAALDAAGAGWRERRRVPDALAAMIDAAGCHLRAGRAMRAATAAQAAVDGAEMLGGPPLVGRARTILDAARARHPQDEPWAPLTAREFEIAKLVTDGGTNAAIAEQLGISPRTVGAHIEHILAKLGVGRRAEIAAWIAARPVLHSRPHGRDREE